MSVSYQTNTLLNHSFKMPHFTRNHSDSDSLKAFYIENQNVGNKDSTEDWRSKYWVFRFFKLKITNATDNIFLQFEDTTH